MTYQVLSHILKDLLAGASAFGASMPSAMDLSIDLHPTNVRVGIGIWAPVINNGHQAGNIISSPVANSAAGSVNVA